MQTILPSTLMVVTSFFSFLIPVTQVTGRTHSKKLSFMLNLSNKIPGRMTLCITTLLTLVAMSSGVFQNSPRTSYMKAIDVWLFGCFLSSFAVLLHFSVVVFLNSRPENREGQPGLSPYRRRVTAAVDRCGRVAMPVGFLLFSVGYNLYYEGNYVKTDLDIEGYTLHEMEGFYSRGD